MRFFHFGVLVSLGLLAESSTQAASGIDSSPALVETAVYPALPPAFLQRAGETCAVSETDKVLILANGFLSAKISTETGLIVEIQNRLTGESYPLEKDKAGFSWTIGGRKIEWLAGAGHDPFEVAIKREDTRCGATLITGGPSPGSKVQLSYTLGTNQFWIERRLSADLGLATYDQLFYGRAEIPGAAIHQLKLGKFDAPRLLSRTKGGIFAGVGWWFYEVQDGLYQNTQMDWQTQRVFESEPWYVGVFQNEPGEPYSGWFWYKSFLSERKLANDRQRAYALWNARSGYSFSSLSNSDLLSFSNTASQLPLAGITAGEVRGLSKATSLAKTNPVARQVIDSYAAIGVTIGVHEGDVQASNWATDAALNTKLRNIDAAREQGIRNLTVDFLKVKDRFPDHRRLATFFRYIREKMDYTECHLGMAVYGPQFQREVLINHPTDLKGFDISRFSSDWTTLAGFRHSRRGWQKQYDYLMPENGLFYFCTHYSNYPRRYLDPEPQQFLYVADAWRGLAYAFHDKFGFRNSVAAQAAFSTFYVFGFLDSRIPQEDADFARAYLGWVRENANVLSRGRVCFESEDALVMSKVLGSRGGLFLLNYTPGEKHFKLNFRLPDSIAVRQLYPSRGEARPLAPGSPLEIDVAGESLAVLEVNDGFQGDLPESHCNAEISITDWKRTSEGLSGTFSLPGILNELKRNADKSLPNRLVSADQTETEVLMHKNSGKSPGKLPREFLNVYGFEQDKYLPTWKAVPWAFADRAWIVYVPEKATAITAPKPAVLLNGSRLEMAPRVRYDPRSGLAKPQTWDIPMWFADITEDAKFGAINQVVLKNDKPGTVFIALPPTGGGRATP